MIGLLVISRSVGKCICIGDEIRIKVLKVDGGLVYLGVTDSSGILALPNDSDELLDRDLKEKQGLTVSCINN